MSDSKTVEVKSFMQQTLELSRHFLRLKIQAEAEELLPFEQSLIKMRSEGRSSEVRPETMARINSILRLREELKLMNRLSAVVERSL